MSDAIQRAGKASADCYHAKKLLTAVLGFPFPDYEAGPWRSADEICALLRRAISVAGGHGFAEHAGGWRVSSGPRVPVSIPNVHSLRRGAR